MKVLYTPPPGNVKKKMQKNQIRFSKFKNSKLWFFELIREILEIFIGSEQETVFFIVERQKSNSNFDIEWEKSFFRPRRTARHNRVRVDEYTL